MPTAAYREAFSDRSTDTPTTRVVLVSKQRGRPHPVYIVQRASAIVLGLGLWVFAGLGFAQGLAFFSTEGQDVLGLSSNGLLSTISVVAGGVLLASAAYSAPAASTVAVVVGTLFLLSGLAHLAILHTAFNFLAFRLPNVFFSLIAGMVLLFSGLYGRVSGGLPPDNPYRRAHPRRSQRPHPDDQLSAQHAVSDPEEQRIREAEVAMGEGHASGEQAAIVEHDQAKRRAEERDRAWRHVNHGLPGSGEAPR